MMLTYLIHLHLFISVTIRDSESPSLIRRLSTMLHSSFRATRFMSRRDSDASSQNSPRMSRSMSTSSPTHTLLRRATSKTAKGSSIIRKDGSLIITKNGKIISYRHDADSVKRDRSFSGFEDLENRRNTNGVTKSLSELRIGDRVELTPLLKRNDGVSSISSPTSGSSTPPRMKYSHTSLTKIDSVEENETNDSQPAGNRLNIPASKLDRQLSQSDTAVALLPGGATKPAIVAPSEKSNSPSVSIRSDLDDVFIQSSEKLNPVYHSQDGLLNTMPLTPVLKDSNQIARSENDLDKDSELAEKVTKIPASNSSTNIAYKVPLLRCPSIEKLDTPTSIPRCSSDAGSIRKLQPRSPLYIRRWLSNKLVDQPSKAKS